MKIEVGMYVRTDRVGIERIYKIDNNKTKYKYLFKLKHQDDDGCIDLGVLCDDNIIGEPSFNVIDLLKIGDLVEIEFYSPRYETRVTRLFEVDVKDDDNMMFANAYCRLYILKGNWSNEDKELKPVFKSIVTKEQFEQMKYNISE